MSCHPNIADPLILHHPKRMKSLLAEIMKLTPLPPPPPPLPKKKIVHSTPEYKKNDITFENFLSTINMSICYPSIMTSKL